MPALSRSKNGVASLAYVAGIHVFMACGKAKTWMAETSPAMTAHNTRSPDGAERNPGLPRGVDAAPDFAPLHPGYVRYGDFIKDAAYLALLVKRFGGAGSGNQYHHIVTQGGANNKIPAERLQNTDNIIPLPTLLHEAVNGEYSKLRQGTNMTEYQWLQTQPYDVQREEGLKILRRLHILK